MSSNNDNDNNNDDKRIPDQQSEPQVSQAHTDTLSSTKVNETSQPKETQSIKTKPEEKSVPENKSESETKEEQSLTQEQQVQQQEEQQDNDEQDFGPIFVRLERKQHPQVAFKLDPQQTVQDLGSFTLEMPTEVFEQLGAKHKKRLKGQIQDIQEQLEKVKALLEWICSCNVNIDIKYSCPSGRGENEMTVSFFSLNISNLIKVSAVGDSGIHFFNLFAEHFACNLALQLECGGQQVVVNSEFISCQIDGSDLLKALQIVLLAVYVQCLEDLFLDLWRRVQFLFGQGIKTILLCPRNKRVLVRYDDTNKRRLFRVAVHESLCNKLMLLVYTFNLFGSNVFTLTIDMYS